MPEILVASRDYEQTLAENIALKNRLSLIECNRDMGLFVRLLEEFKWMREQPSQEIKDGVNFVCGFNGPWITVRPESAKLFRELIARANEGAKK